MLRPLESSLADNKGVVIMSGSLMEKYLIHQQTSEVATNDSPNPTANAPEENTCVYVGPSLSETSEEKRTKFVKDLESLINCASLENESDTPDFILAEFLRDCMEAYTKATNSRRNWYGYPENKNADRR
jgi:hypothetical protein